MDGAAISFRLPTWSARDSAMQKALSACTGPDTISLALGIPAPEMFPTEELAASAEAVLRSGPGVLQYGPPDPRLKTQIVEMMATRGVECSEEQIFLTAGAQQGLTLLGRLFLKPADVVVTEQTVYPGFRQVVESCDAQLLPVPVETGVGPDLDVLRSFLARDSAPVMYYTVPEGHNPLGISMDEEMREAICELACQFRIPVIEDDPYGFLTYDSSKKRPLWAREQEYVFYVGSFSKIIAPGLRVGWLIVPSALIPALGVAKEATDIDSATFSQRLISHFIASGYLEIHLNRLRLEYSLRRDVMIHTLREEMPPGCRYCTPHSGVFVWVELPEGIDTNVFARAAMQEQVLVLPGEAFAVWPDAYTRRCLRLNFSSNPPNRIREGVRRLAAVLKREAIPKEEQTV